MTRHWWQDAVVYQIYPRSFMDSNGDGIGDLPGILSKLDYLQWLGVDTLWLCPIHPSPNDDNGYDISDYQDILAEFGTLADFDALLAEVHRRGMRLILDLVINHTSDQHPWFLESRSSRDNPKRDWYFWRDGRNGGPPNNWESIFKGPAWEYDPHTDQYFLHLFTRRQPDLNWDNPAVRAAISDLVRWWLARGVDGFRIDAITHLKKAPGLPDAPNPEGLPQAPAYALHMNVNGILDHLDALCAAFAGRELLTVGEANGITADEAEAWVGFARRRLSMILHFEHWHLWSNAPEAPLEPRALQAIFGRWQQALDGRGWNALYLENHDLPRVVSRWGDPGQYRAQSASALATACFLLQGTPFIYQGQELGMVNTRFDSLDAFDDVFARNRIAELRAAGLSDAAILQQLALTARDNSRTPMPWRDAPQAGFTTGRAWLAPNPDYPEINVERQLSEPDSVLHYFRRLLALRREEPALRFGAYQPLPQPDPQFLAYLRDDGDERLAIVCNLGRQAADYHHPTALPAPATLLLGNYPRCGHPDWIRFQPYEARVFRLESER